jgi:hypothetical protein
MNHRMGVALAFAVACPALGSIVFVPDGSGLWEQLSPPNNVGVPIDVNQDGVLDLGFYHHVASGLPQGYYESDWYDDATGGSGYSQVALVAGALAGPGTAFTTSGRSLGTYVQNFFFEPPHYEYSGTINIPQGNSYWGLEFVGAGASVSYGWVQFYGFNNVTTLGGGSVVVQVVDYAYETQAGVPIAAGAVPAPSGVAVIGVVGIACARRRR